MRGVSWRVYLGVAGALLAGYLVVPEDSWFGTAWNLTIVWSGVAAIAAGLRLNRPPGTVAWLLCAAGLFLNGLGNLVVALQERVFHLDVWPGPSDAFWLCLYPFLGAGLALLVRLRTGAREWASLVDAATITTGLGLLSWIFLIRPAIGDVQDVGMSAQVVVIAYPVGDIVLLAMLVRLLMTSRTGNASFWLMSGSIGCFLVGDTVWAVLSELAVEPAPFPERLLNMLFMLAFPLFGAAVLHPAVRDVGHVVEERTGRLSPLMLGLLAGASLIAPAILAVQVARHRVTDGGAIALGSFALFLLVVTRMAQLLRQVERQALQLRELARVDELTGLPNRRAWTVELPSAIELARRDLTPLSVAMVDLDHFKRFNDEYGHQAGDRLLKSAAAAWREQLRAVDHLARYGGEEFILLLPNADAGAASEVIDRLRAATPAGQTFSSGVATWDGGETSDELVARADVALYAAKQAGRDRTVVAAAAPGTGTAATRAPA
jgi:diguanylate cyclase (GGDEF)-like protein